jgi:hypothetical protein
VFGDAIMYKNIRINFPSIFKNMEQFPGFFCDKKEKKYREACLLSLWRLSVLQHPGFPAIQTKSNSSAIKGTMT